MTTKNVLFSPSVDKENSKRVLVTIPGRSERSNLFQSEEALNALKKPTGHYPALGAEQLFHLPSIDT